MNTFLADGVHAEGIELSKVIIALDDWGGAYRTTQDVTVTAAGVKLLQTFGDYKIQVGDVVPKG